MYTWVDIVLTIAGHIDSIFWACKNGLLESWCVVGNRQLPVPAARELYLMVCTSPDEALVDAVIHEVASLYKNQVAAMCYSNVTC